MPIKKNKTEEVFSIGDVVFLKSGSPPLTVSALLYGAIVAVYINLRNDGALARLSLPAGCFQRTDPADKSDNGDYIPD